jgi:hypothetical protein
VPRFPPWPHPWRWRGAPGRSEHDHAFCAGQALGAFGTVAEGLARYQDTIEPGLELARNGEIIHRRTDHDDVGLDKLVEDRGTRNCCFGGVGGHRGEIDMRQRRGREVAMIDLQRRIGRAQPADDRCRQRTADRVFAEDAGIDVEKFHIDGPSV